MTWIRASKLKQCAQYETTFLRQWLASFIMLAGSSSFTRQDYQSARAWGVRRIASASFTGYTQRLFLRAVTKFVARNRLLSRSFNSCIDSKLALIIGFINFVFFFQ